MAENAREKNQILSKFAANFLKANIIAMNVDNAVSQSKCFCEAFDMVFHDHKVLSYVNTLLFICLIYHHCVSHNQSWG